MRILFLLLVGVALISCSSPESYAIDENIYDKLPEKTPLELESPITGIDSLELGLVFEPSGNYNDVKSRIKRNMALGKHSKEDFEQYLLNEIIPHWYGTEWDFNGYTSTPNKGVIACGYFVSTTLLHMGLNVNRYHLAQQAGLNEAKSLAITEEHYESIWGFDKLKEAVQSRYEDGIYFVGLDNHVGYLYIKNKEMYFIHSNYIADKVMLEKAELSEAFQSNIYVVAELSTNEDFLNAWRKNDLVKVYRQ